MLDHIDVRKLQGKQKEQIWGLIIDNEGKNEMTHEEIVERNNLAREAFKNMNL